jgi:acetylornithine aminotransferase
MARGFIVNCVQEKVLRFAPPLIVSREEIDRLIVCLEEILKN